MVVTFSGIVMLVRLLHSQKTYSSREVTRDGIVMSLRLRHRLKAYSPINETPSGIEMLGRLIQCWNANSPIDVRLSGSCTDTKLKKRMNELLAISVIPSEITMDVTWFLISSDNGSN